MLERDPGLDGAMSVCVRAWSDLSTCRSIGMSAGPIPWTAMIQWCAFHELDHDSTTLVTGVVSYLDRDWFEREESKRRLDEAKGKAQWHSK